jgi:hypothetical protein
VSADRVAASPLKVGVAALLVGAAFATAFVWPPGASVSTRERESRNPVAPMLAASPPERVAHLVAERAELRGWRVERMLPADGRVTLRVVAPLGWPEASIEVNARPFDAGRVRIDIDARVSDLPTDLGWTARLVRQLQGDLRDGLGLR